VAADDSADIRQPNAGAFEVLLPMQALKNSEEFST
jgi:hypothetical protein